MPYLQSTVLIQINFDSDALSSSHLVNTLFFYFTHTHPTKHISRLHRVFTNFPFNNWRRKKTDQKKRLKHTLSVLVVPEGGEEWGCWSGFFLTPSSSLALLLSFLLLLFRFCRLSVCVCRGKLALFYAPTWLEGFCFPLTCTITHNHTNTHTHTHVHRPRIHIRAEKKTRNTF